MARRKPQSAAPPQTEPDPIELAIQEERRQMEAMTVATDEDRCMKHAAVRVAALDLDRAILKNCYPALEAGNAIREVRSAVTRAAWAIDHEVPSA